MFSQSNSRGALQRSIKKVSFVSSLALLLSLAGCGGAGDSAPSTSLENSYAQTNLVASNPSYNPQILDATMVDAWGISIRPAGAGGHFWVTAGPYSYEYVGDANGTALYQDALKRIDIPGATLGGHTTGTVYNGAAGNFMITQAHPNGAITNGSKFMFVTDKGVLSAWTERNNGGGSFDRPSTSISKVDYSASGAQFFGLAINPTYSKVYVANFGVGWDIKTFDSNFNDVTASHPFTNPFTSSMQPGDYAPFNVQVLGNPGSESVFVTYAKTRNDPSNPGQIFAGEEDASVRGYGKLVEYDLNGNLIAVWNDQGLLRAPWGMVIAPANFGQLSNNLLVGNFGEGTIVAFDRSTRKAVNYVRDNGGLPVVIDGLWALLFGNGASLGDSNALYFAAGPAGENDGLFGALRYAPKIK